MTFQQELTSWLSPPSINVSPAPTTGLKAPSTTKLPFPNPDGKDTVVTFLRHCGCPFAEKTFALLCDAASSYPSISFVAISHSIEDSTQKWQASLPFTTCSNVKVVVDHDRETYAKWGLGASSFWHVLNPWALWSVYALGKNSGIYNRPTESGYRWQTSGSWAVDGKGKVVWGGVAKSADDIPDFEDALNALSVKT